jgi:hypothetical protein
MTIETQVAALTTSTTALVTAVGAQQINVDDAIASFNTAIETVNNDLNNVDNTSDANKPVSTAQQAELDLLQPTLVSGVNISTVNGVSILGGGALVIERSPTSLASLGYEDRRTLLNDPVLPNLPNVVDDSVIVEGIGLFMWVTTTDEPDDDETCFTTPSGQWLLRQPSYDLLSAWAMIEDSIIEEHVEDNP